MYPSETRILIATVIIIAIFGIIIILFCWCLAKRRKPGHHLTRPHRCKFHYSRLRDLENQRVTSGSSSAATSYVSTPRYPADSDSSRSVLTRRMSSLSDKLRQIQEEDPELKRRFEEIKIRGADSLSTPSDADDLVQRSLRGFSSESEILYSLNYLPSDLEVEAGVETQRTGEGDNTGGGTAGSSQSTSTQGDCGPVLDPYWAAVLNSNFNQGHPRDHLQRLGALAKDHPDPDIPNIWSEITPIFQDLLKANQIMLLRLLLGELRNPVQDIRMFIRGVQFGHQMREYSLLQAHTLHLESLIDTMNVNNAKVVGRLEASMNQNAALASQVTEASKNVTHFVAAVEKAQLLAEKMELSLVPPEVVPASKHAAPSIISRVTETQKAYVTLDAKLGDGVYESKIGLVTIVAEKVRSVAIHAGLNDPWMPLVGMDARVFQIMACVNLDTLESKLQPGVLASIFTGSSEEKNSKFGALIGSCGSAAMQWWFATRVDESMHDDLSGESSSA
ncbi:hypothetical protein 2 [Hubei rhabdo-like virus 1]|uniref:hypothetical protein 2 n=1 Tax=Hubei rhabdo-like virus 1 TaxID=1923185 RepID=UPI000909E730|nr:hypothetical protein 2 [Hubei rhabdo-like virus 1]APG78707.1 hypothetical protein 2 [Hubei rhabdo-like virus 1]